MYTAFLVDDEPIVLKKLQSMPAFLECGFKIIGYSTNSVQAVKEILDCKPDVVVTDLKMSGFSGVEMLEEIFRSGWQCQGIILSAYGEFESARRFFTSGGFDYLIKPVSEKDLAQVLDKLALYLEQKKIKQPVLSKTTSKELNLILADLNQNISAKHSLDSLGQKYGLNPNSICNLFAKHLDQTFITYITALRMNEAGRLLKESSKAIKEIAVLCGYQEYFYFCRVFRNYYGCTPSGYREDNS